MQTPSNQVYAKWIKVLSTPINPVAATAIISDLYRCIGYPLPKIVFVDSPWATSTAAKLFLHQSSSVLNSVRDDLLNLFKQVYAQLLRQLFKQFDNLSVDCLKFAGQLSDLAATNIYFHEEAEDYWGYDATADPWYGYRRTELDELTILAGGVDADLNNDQIATLLHNLNHRLIQQLNVQINELPLEAETYFLPLSKPIWCSEVTDAAVFDKAASIGVQFESELLTLFLRSALHLGFINPFKEICFVSDRPRFIRDARNRNNLHAEGGPAVVFPDSFGTSYFYHGTELPQYIGMVHPSQWQPQWILQEQNAEVRRWLIQEIGYARMCQELQAEELDLWREYTLLKLAVYDDYSQTPELHPWQRREEVKGEATYLLKMTCPSTGCIYAIRVPPNIHSAREAATWINWGSDPEWFALET